MFHFIKRKYLLWIFFILICSTHNAFPTLPESLRYQSTSYIVDHIDSLRDDIRVLPNELVKKIGYACIYEARTLKQLGDSLSLIFSINKSKGTYSEKEVFEDIERIKDIYNTYCYKITRICVEEDFEICAQPSSMLEEDLIELHGYRAEKFLNDYSQGLLAAKGYMLYGNLFGDEKIMAIKR